MLICHVDSKNCLTHLTLKGNVMKRPALLLIVLGLAACATPQDRCAGPELRDLARVQDRIATLEQDLNRGYRVKNPSGVTLGIGGCTGGNIQFCLSKQTQPGARQVPVNRAGDEAELQTLRQQESRLRQAVVVAVRACEG